VQVSRAVRGVVQCPKYYFYPGVYLDCGVQKRGQCRTGQIHSSALFPMGLPGTVLDLLLGQEQRLTSS